ncbi:MAG: FHA domain-containing protein [Betaproteobacteria bacterium]
MTTHVFVVEILDGHGRVRSHERVELPAGGRSVSVGRSVQADIVLDDPHVAALHALIDVNDNGDVHVSDLDSVNGIIIASKSHHGVRQLAVPDGLLQIGRTRLRVRTAQETLVPERPDHAPTILLGSHPGRVAGLAALAFFAYVGYTAWLGAPRDVLSQVVTTVTFAAVGAAVWITGWALLSRMLSGEWRWLRHAAVFFGVMTVALLVSTLLDIFWFAFALPQWNTREAAIAAGAFAFALYGHLSIAANINQRYAALVAALFPIMVAGTTLWVQSRSQARNVNYIGVEELIYPPALRLRAGAGIDAYFERAARLKDAADAKRKAMPADDEGGESDSEE